MASQTTYYGSLLKPELDGGKFSVIMGTHKFTSSATTCTLTVPFKNEIVGVYIGWVTPPNKTPGKYIYASATIKTKAIIVSRSTGSSSGVTFWYKLIGW